MEKSSSKKHFLAGVIILIVVAVAFFLGWFTGTNVPLYNNSKCCDSETVDSIPIFDKIGGGNPVIKREFWGLPFGSSRHEVQTRMDRLGEFDFLESESFPGMFLAKYTEVEIDSTYFAEIRFYFYKERLAMVQFKYSDQSIQRNASSILSDLTNKYGNLDSLNYTSDPNTVGALKGYWKGIPEFYPQWDNSRIKSLRDGHTIINIFDHKDNGVFLLYYDRLSKWQEDVNAKRQNAL